MSRYIDLEELEKRINENIKPETLEEKALIEWCKDECIRQGYAMPRADVEEVRHGRWLPIIERSSYLDPPYYDTGKCSSCGYVADVSEMRYKCCPECGAKMDGERNENGT